MKTECYTYEADFAGWAFQQADLLRHGKLQDLDLINLIEEIETVGRSEHRALGSRFVVLLAHLLKWQFQPVYRGNSWKNTIRTQRRGIEDLLSDSPSLKTNFLNPEWIKRKWEDAVSAASNETGLAESAFPSEPIWEIEQILNIDFLPDNLQQES